MCNQQAMLAKQRTRTFSQTERDQQQRQEQQQPRVANGQKKTASPPAELSESNEWMRLAVDLPGVQPKDLDVNINHGVLTIEGSRRTMSVDGSVCVKKQKISRRYAIDANVVDVLSATANLKFGVLTITAPKKPKSNRVRVDVTAEDEGVTAEDEGNTLANLTSRYEEAQAMSPPSSTPTSPLLASVKEQHVMVQLDDGTNDLTRIENRDD